MSVGEITGGPSAVPDVHDRVVALRRRVHHHPELGLHLPRTQEAVLEELADLDLEITTGTSTTSVVADLVGASDGPTVLLRGDMDALPMPEDTGLDFASEVSGRMHACGHDAHTAMLAGAARVLAGRRDRIRGRVRFMFQPGEEGFHGARYMIDEGVCDGVDHAFALHIMPNLASGHVGVRPGPMLAAADTFEITITGKGGHGSMPHQTIDPIPIVGDVIASVQAMVTRRVEVFDPAVVSITRVQAGTTDNVIAEHAELAGTIRTFSASQRSFIHERLTSLVEGIAAANGARADVSITRGYPVTVNDPAAADLLLAAARTALGSDRVVEVDRPLMAAEDFSYVLERVPGAMGMLGVCPPGHRPEDAPACHSNRMLLDEGAMAAGVAVHVAVAESLLT